MLYKHFADKLLREILATHMALGWYLESIGASFSEVEDLLSDAYPCISQHDINKAFNYYREVFAHESKNAIIESAKRSQTIERLEKCYRQPSNNYSVDGG